MPNTKKKEQVQHLCEQITEYNNFAVISYERTPHKEMEGLRKELKKTGSGMKVLKNSLFQKAVEHLSHNNSNYSDIVENMFPIKGSSAIVGFGEEWFDGLKKYHESTKKNDSLDYLFGFIDNSVQGKEGMHALATLPSREELLAKVIGGMKSPLMKTTYALKFNMQRFTTVLNEKAKQG
ncbi:MAG: 50S ribosomal protein L10 [Patescibacteria group bacterium]